MDRVLRGPLGEAPSPLLPACRVAGAVPDVVRDRGPAAHDSAGGDRAVLPLARGLGSPRAQARAHLLPAPDVRAKAIAERPAFLTRHGDDPAIVWTGLYGEHNYVECDWIPEADEWAHEAPVLARLWGALHGCVPVQVRFRCPANGDYARVALRPALPGEDPGPREPFVSRGR